jgi:hypothetical protein
VLAGAVRVMVVFPLVTLCNVTHVYSFTTTTTNVVNR